MALEKLLSNLMGRLFFCVVNASLLRLFLLFPALIPQ
jgi:hypothetical protein